MAFSKRFVPRVIHSFMTDLNPEDVPSLLHLLHYTLSCKLDCLKRFDQASHIRIALRQKVNDSGERLVSQEKLGIPNLILFNIGKKIFSLRFYTVQDEV